MRGFLASCAPVDRRASAARRACAESPGEDEEDADPDALGDREHLQAMLVRRFSPEYQTAFVAWPKTAPFTTPSAPPGPAYLPEYHTPQLEQAEHLNEEAAVAEEEGTHARETAEKYIGATVLFALVLFLVAVSQRFRILGVRIGAIAMAVVLLGYALYEVATLPRF